jgi:hypothetical protein
MKDMQLGAGVKCKSREARGKLQHLTLSVYLGRFRENIQYSTFNAQHPAKLFPSADLGGEKEKTEQPCGGPVLHCWSEN